MVQIAQTIKLMELLCLNPFLIRAMVQILKHEDTTMNAGLNPFLIRAMVQIDDIKDRSVENLGS